MSASLKELQNRLRLYRIYYSLTQKELSEKAGVSVRSITRFENGEDITLSNFLKILDALGLADSLQFLIPDQTQRPSYFLPQAKQRKRAAVKKKEPAKEFKWGDEAK